MTVEMENLVKKVRTEDSPVPNLRTVLESLYKGEFARHPILVVFCTGETAPADFIQMKRDPQAAAGFAFDETFARRHSEAIALNESIHDGAVLFLRRSIVSSYACLGWSYRIVSRDDPVNAEANRGSAYNSALACSASSAVDGVFLVGGSGIEAFVEGRQIWPADGVSDT